MNEEEAESLLDLKPDANVLKEQAIERLKRIIHEEEGFYSIHPALIKHLNEVAQQKSEQLLDSHKRVRQASARKGIRQFMEPQLPPDILGVYLFIPIPKN